MLKVTSVLRNSIQFLVIYLMDISSFRSLCGTDNHHMYTNVLYRMLEILPKKIGEKRILSTKYNKMKMRLFQLQFQLIAHILYHFVVSRVYYLNYF